MHTTYKLDNDTSPLIVHKVGQGECSDLKKIGICLQLLAIVEVIHYTHNLPIGALVGGSIFTFGAYKLALI